MTTIIDQYIKTNNQLIIAVAGFSGIGKTGLAKELHNDLGLQLILLSNYTKKDHSDIITLPNNEKINNHDSLDYYDWERFNRDVNTNKKNGIIISGIGFPTDKINFNIDYYAMLRAPKQLLMEIRHNYIKKHKDELADLFKLIDTVEEKQLFNSIIYPFYLKIVETSRISKFYNINSQEGNIYDDLFNNVIKFIQDTIYDKRRDLKWNGKEYVYIN